MSYIQAVLVYTVIFMAAGFPLGYFLGFIMDRRKIPVAIVIVLLSTPLFSQSKRRQSSTGTSTLGALQ